MEALTALSLPFGFNSTFSNLSISVFQTLFLYFFEYGEQQDGIGRSDNKELMFVYISNLIVVLKKLVFETCA